jgi:hypothetical protein
VLHEPELDAGCWMQVEEEEDSAQDAAAEMVE